jgi:hypothetical protein
MTLQTSTYHDGPQAYASHFEHAMALLRFPNFSLKACLFGFQGLLFESLVLLRRDDRTAVEAVVGAAGLLLCLGMLAGTHAWGSRAATALKKEDVDDGGDDDGDDDVRQPSTKLTRPSLPASRTSQAAVYVPYTNVAAQLPAAVRYAFLPDGFWLGSNLFVRKFGALFDTFEARHIWWVAPVHLVRATLIGVLSAVKPDDVDGCRAVYVTLAVVFFSFSLLFLATRPHRAPFDDLAATVLNLCSGLLALAIGAPIAGINRDALYLFVVYAAMASAAVAATVLALEIVTLRRREVLLRDGDGDGGARAASADGADDEAAADRAVVEDRSSSSSSSGGMASASESARAADADGGLADRDTAGRESDGAFSDQGD